MNYAERGGPRAVSLVTRAVKSGRLTKATTCQDCGTEGPLQGHHHNGYDEAHVLDVVWLCRGCHQVRHGSRARVPSWERGARAYAIATGRNHPNWQYRSFGDWSMPKHLLKTLGYLWRAFRTDEERAAAHALIAEIEKEPAA